MRKLPLLVIIGTIIITGLVGAGTFFALRHDDPQPKQAVTTVKNSAVTQPAQNTTKPSATPQETDQDSPSHSLTEPSSIWMIVNKKFALPSGYVPGSLTNIGSHQLRNEAAAAAKQLISAAGRDGVTVKVISGYRSYAYQKNLYANYVQQHGQSEADTFSARPGHSEHQTGLAADFGTGGACDLETCFATTTAGKWLAVHAHEYGFVIRYGETMAATTGYQYEPWHLRYVGTWLAQKIHDNPQPLETYFRLGAAPDYE